MAAPTTGITGFIPNINGGISGFSIAYGTYTTATISFVAPPIPPGYSLSTVEVHWFLSGSSAENSSGTLTANGGTYSFAINEPKNTIINVQIVFYVTPPTGNLAFTFASGSNLLQSGGIGTSITENNMSTYASPSTQVVVSVQMSGGGGMN
jgi:hypothetical protein